MLSNRARSVGDIIIFTLTVLNPPRLPAVVLSLALALAGFYFLVSDMYSQAWISLSVAIISGIRNILSLGWRWLRSPALSWKTDPALNRFLAAITLDEAYRDRGYIIECAAGSNEPVARSRTVDSWLRSNQLSVTAGNSEVHREKLNQILAADASRYEDILRCGHRRSVQADPPRQFVNETKTCLGSDLLEPTQPIEIFRGSYFHSFLTNELVSRVLYTRGRHPRPLFQGHDHYPAHSDNTQVSQLKHIADSAMSNHIGVSTIAHTLDNQLMLWRQGEAAQQSREYLAPTGSGSCDWSDWQACQDDCLNTLLAHAMERELREESTLDRRCRIETRVIGYFRWLRRGGKPEFLGISKVGLSRSQLLPDAREVDDPLARRTAYPANTLPELKRSIERLLEADALSVPLRLNLQCLQEALAQAPEHWCQFLAIPAKQPIESEPSPLTISPSMRARP